ncbi:MAG: thymidine kinase [Candidatus Marinimicrobia bacterium]|nr:thymidine kinase [Candidatus Neomarinimicrobiota bacterium]|tara:strand:- start:6193 stop:6747 length:555 start_codon:yes stop_codon:yes gene_type:complete
MNKKNQRLGWIEVICGPMFSGKTEELIRRLKRAIIAKNKILVFKPKIDNRYSDSLIVSHNNNSIESITIDNEDKILDNIPDDINIIGIDEIQFFKKGIIDICIKLANKNKRVIVSGLDKDFQGKPFGIMPNILSEAEYISKLNAICNVCGDYAFFTKRISKDKEQILLGELDKYEANCRNCFYK